MSRYAGRTTRYRTTLAAPVAVVVALVMLPVPGQAQWGLEGRMQMGFGGDELGTVEYSNGSSSALKLGTYFSFLAGPIFEAWRSGASSLELQGMVGWSGWATGPENTDDRLKLNRFPVEALAFYGYRMPARDMQLRIGGGVTYHLAGGVSGSGSLDGLDIGIDKALGGTGEVGLVYGILSMGLRYTHLSATVEGLPASLDGSSIAIFGGLTTPRN